MSTSLLLVRPVSVYTAALLFTSGTQVGITRNMPYRGLLFDPFMAIIWIQYGGEDVISYYPWRGFTSEHFAGQPGSVPCAIMPQLR